MTRSTPIQISRRMLALGMIATAGIGVGAGELAAPLTSGQAAAPSACRAFATNVASALKDLGVVVSVEAHYATYIPKAYKDGTSHDVSSYAKISTALGGLVGQVLKENKAFQKLQTPLLNNERTCLAG